MISDSIVCVSGGKVATARCMFCIGGAIVAVHHPTPEALPGRISQPAAAQKAGYYLELGAGCGCFSQLPVLVVDVFVTFARPYLVWARVGVVAAQWVGTVSGCSTVQHETLPCEQRRRLRVGKGWGGN